MLGWKSAPCICLHLHPRELAGLPSLQLRPAIVTGIGTTGHPAACSLSRSRTFRTREGLFQPPRCTYNSLFACSCGVRALRLLHGQDRSKCCRKQATRLSHDVDKDCQHSACAARSVTSDCLQASAIITTTAFATTKHVLWPVEQPQGSFETTFCKHSEMLHLSPARLYNCKDRQPKTAIRGCGQALLSLTVTCTGSFCSFGEKKSCPVGRARYRGWRRLHSGGVGGAKSNRRCLKLGCER